jgi:hypothetical protein
MCTSVMIEMYVHYLQAKQSIGVGGDRRLPLGRGERGESVPVKLAIVYVQSRRVEVNLARLETLNRQGSPNTTAACARIGKKVGDL